MAIQSAPSDGGLAELQALLRQQPAGGSAFGPVRRHNAGQNAALAQQQSAAIEAFLLPYKVKALEAEASGQDSRAQMARLELRQLQEQIAGSTNVARGLGMSGAGELNARAALQGPGFDMARMRHANQQSRAVATEIEQASMSPADRMDQAMQGLGFAPGEFGEMMRLNKIGANANKAQQLDLQAGVDAVLGSVEGSLSEMAGKPMQVFSLQDRGDALSLLQQQISQGASPDDVLTAVLQVASARAQSRFLELTAAESLQPELLAQPRRRGFTAGEDMTASQRRARLPTPIDPILGLGMR